MSAHRLHVVGIGSAGITSTTIISIPLKRNMFKHGWNATDMVKVVVAYEEIVDVLDAELVEVRDRLGTISVLHVLANVKHHKLSAWRVHNCPVSLANIHMVNLKLAIALSLRQESAPQHE